MAYTRTNLSGAIGGGSNAPKFYTYKDTGSNKAAVATDDYFLDLNDILNVGDAILCNCSDGTIILVAATVSSTTVVTELLEVVTA